MGLQAARRWVCDAALLVVVAACAADGAGTVRHHRGATSLTTTGGGATTTGTSAGTTTDDSIFLMWTDVEGSVATDTDGDGVADVGCGADTLDLDIGDGFGGATWLFGMIDSTGGWAGEDCLFGAGDPESCHVVGTQHTLTQVCSPDQVILGRTTLFDASRDPYLTYVLWDDVGSCWAWGLDVAYYVSLGC